MTEQPVSVSPAGVRAERIVVWAPVGRTSTLIANALEQGGLESVVCEDADAFCRLVREGAGAAILLEEVFVVEGHTERVGALLEAQPSWSDLPMKVFVSDYVRILPAYRRLCELSPRHGVTVLERPVSPPMLVSVMQAALRHRRRQYELRDVLETLGATVSSLEERVEKQTYQLRRLAARLTRTEQAERRRISQLLHDDVQQLLYGVAMKTQMAARTADDRTREHLEEAGRWVDQAVGLTRQLTTELSPHVLEEESLTDAMQWLCAHMGELHGLGVTVEADGPHRVEDADLRALLFQIVRELLFNVKKHAGVAEARVRVTQEAGHVAVHVIDDGRGFDPGEAVDHDEHQGGFGLFSVRERLHLMGGRLDIRSAPGEGTHVIVHASSENGAAAAGGTATASGRDRTPPQTLRIFVVDDHPVLREMLVMLFEQEEDLAICGEAQGGEEAMRKIAAAAPDVVLVDVSLPDMSGVALVRALREQRPGLRIVMLSAHAEAHYVEQALDAGAAGYVLKGDAASVTDAIRQVDRGVYVSPLLRRHVRVRPDPPSIRPSSA